MSRSAHVIEGESICWPDSSLENLEAGYDEIVLRIHEERGVDRLLICLGYIGFQMKGFWDETIIECATLHHDHPFIAECEIRLKDQPDSGSEARIRSGNRVLEITFIDGCKFLICASRFRCQNVPV